MVDVSYKSFLIYYSTLHYTINIKKQTISDVSKYTNTTVYVTDLVSFVTLYYNGFIMLNSEPKVKEGTIGTSLKQ